jgi:Lrp/AsnC family leucine-responsive transcriptional regulator
MVDRLRIDRIDARIIEILQADGRRPYADIGADVGISGPSAHERVKKLEARGIIRGYGAFVDPSVVGYGVVAFAWVRQAPGTVATDLTGDFALIPELEECHHITGEADYLVKIRARDTRDLERVLTSSGNAPCLLDRTDVVFSTAFERRPLRLARETDSAEAS